MFGDEMNSEEPEMLSEHHVTLEKCLIHDWHENQEGFFLFTRYCFLWIKIKWGVCNSALCFVTVLFGPYSEIKETLLCIYTHKVKLQVASIHDNTLGKRQWKHTRDVTLKPACGPFLWDVTNFCTFQRADLKFRPAVITRIPFTPNFVARFQVQRQSRLSIFILFNSINCTSSP